MVVAVVTELKKTSFLDMSSFLDALSKDGPTHAANDKRPFDEWPLFSFENSWGGTRTRDPGIMSAVL
jgi:hypothetical protein